MPPARARRAQRSGADLARRRASRSLALFTALGIGFALLPTSPTPAAAQTTLERTPGIGDPSVAYPGQMMILLPHRFVDTDGGGIESAPTFTLALGLPRGFVAGGRFAPRSGVVPGESDEWEAFGRWGAWRQAQGAPVDLAATVAYNGAAESLDAEVSAARWMGGGLRVLGAARAMTSPYGGGDARFALAGGAVWHPRPGSFPVALAGDVATLLDREGSEEVAWSGGVQVGLPFTDYTLSLFATNTSSSTLEGASRGDGETRWGFELTLPVPAGRFLGWYVPREEAAEAVVAEPGGAPDVRVDVSRYLYLPEVIEIEAGGTVQWTNVDAVVHTASSDDGTWDSGAIPPGQSWSARFDRPGRYPYHCGPHPFMQGIIIVR